MAKSYSTPRRSIRFPPDRRDHALIMYNANIKAFAPQDIGLIMDQSQRGAQIILRMHDELALNLRLTVKLGPLDPQLATIVWIKEPDSDLRRVGLEFVDP